MKTETSLELARVRRDIQALFERREKVGGTFTRSQLSRYEELLDIEDKLLSAARDAN